MYTPRTDTPKANTDSGAGPVVPCRGTEWVVSVQRARRSVHYPIYNLHLAVGIARAQPMHIDLSIGPRLPECA